MFFQSKKKRLWRARVTNINPTVASTATPTATSATQTLGINSIAQNQQQQLQQQISCQTEYQQQQQTLSYHPYSQQKQNQNQNQNLNKTQISDVGLNQNLIIDSKMASPIWTDGEVGGGCGDGYCSIEEGFCPAYEEDEDQTMSSVTSSATISGQSQLITVDLSTSTMTANQPMKKSSLVRTDSITMDTSPVRRKNPGSMTIPISGSMSATAANVFRKCCGGNNDSGSTTDTSTNNFYRIVNAKTNCVPRGDGVKDIVTEGSVIPVMQDEKERFRALVGKLKESQLTTLCQVTENGAIANNYQSDCVLVTRELILTEEPNVIACRLWRWPDLKCSQEIKRIPSCPNEKDRVYVCCNPSHWSRLCVQESPPPPYQPVAMERLKTKEDTPKENVADEGHRLFPGSLTTDGEDQSSLQGWCQLAYWEQSERVGRRFLVENSFVNIFSDQPQGDGLCLKTLAQQRRTTTPSCVLKAREKIGLGVTLSHEDDGVWLYNRSLVPVFVHSPTLNDIDCFLQVFKVPPGYCLKAYDSYRAKTQNLVWPSYVAGAKTGPVDPFSMRISFAKGWGPNYTRQDVTACPCWIEVLLSRR